MNRYALSSCRFLWVTGIFFAMATPIPSNAYGQPLFLPERAGFMVRFKNEITPYRVMGAFVLPRERMAIEVLDERRRHRYHLRATEGKAVRLAANTWSWQAPDRPGLYPLKVSRSGTSDSITLNVFVMVPYRQVKNGELNGYHIGDYPSSPLRGLSAYKTPKGFVEVSRGNQDVLVAPHFKLGQFLCKQESDYPKYLVLRERLLLKLELILERANQKGYRARTFHIMSGFRTPDYNRSIGNGRYSRHLWGDASDVFIDENPRDGVMDDLNGDGEVNHLDATLLYRIIDEMYGQPYYRRFIGGLAQYERTEHHGPFVHVDARGFRARW